MNQKLIVRLLEKRGHTVRVATNGREAVELLDSHTFVMMDVRMPVMDGFEATRIIRDGEAASGRNPIPIIGVTAHVMKGDRERCLGAGMTDYISKPIIPHALDRALIQVTAILHSRPDDPQLCRLDDPRRPAQTTTPVTSRHRLRRSSFR